MMLALAPSLVDSEENIASPRILVFDSGLGGLTVFGELRRAWPDAFFLYVADDEVFPYGRLSEAALVERVMALMEQLVVEHRPKAVVIACHTASTLVLPPLRARWPDLPFVGTVPAIKPAAAASRTKRISVLGTPGTVARDYTRALIQSFADGCDVALVGAPKLAALAERHIRGEAVPDDEILAEIAPAFVDQDGRRTDTVVLACTHYPLLLETLQRLSPWAVTFIDPALAIARRTVSVLTERGMHPPAVQTTRASAALFTSGHAPCPALREALSRRGLGVLAA